MSSVYFILTSGNIYTISEELLDGYIEAILLFLRNTSFGPEYKVTQIDPQTDERFTSTILLD